MDWVSLLGAAAGGPVSLILGAGTRLLTGWLQTKQEELKEASRQRDREQELAMRRLDLEAAAQHDAATIKAANIQADAAVRVGAYAADKPTGIKWVDGWNGVMRPGSFTLLWVIWIWLHVVAWLRWPESAIPMLAGLSFPVLVAADINMLLAAMAYIWADRTLGKSMGRTK